MSTLHLPRTPLQLRTRPCHVLHSIGNDGRDEVECSRRLREPSWLRAITGGGRETSRLGLSVLLRVRPRPLSRTICQRVCANLRRNLADGQRSLRKQTYRNRKHGPLSGALRHPRHEGRSIDPEHCQPGNWQQSSRDGGAAPRIPYRDAPYPLQGPSGQCPRAGGTPIRNFLLETRCFQARVIYLMPSHYRL
ncbi:hypothetical protein BDY21DRAFT_13144 [Lineolata rhizophorae]|uniref:Uncharacterized protein n=1 Tax=Lineolata rhizophorae TaxID=578093 RepID=A0A6A6PEE2_9PEZI|nr:hypothetical protein BDY21DRAFT_13144 [Lineolata rhizophorae]